MFERETPRIKAKVSASCAPIRALTPSTLPMPEDPAAALDAWSDESRKIYSPLFQSALASMTPGVKFDQRDEPEPTP